MKEEQIAGIALRRKGIVLLKQPAAGGECCDVELFLNKT